MLLEDYFDFDNPNGIRIRGTKVNLEVVVLETLRGASAAEIVQDYPPLSLEQVHAALTYYYHNRAAVDDYLRQRNDAFELARRQHQATRPPEELDLVRRIQAARQGQVAT
jgi:uncharacterized protein (DUF433 family)